MDVGIFRNKRRCKDCKKSIVRANAYRVKIIYCSTCGEDPLLYDKGAKERYEKAINDAKKGRKKK